MCYYKVIHIITNYYNVLVSSTYTYNQHMECTAHFTANVNNTFLLHQKLINNHEKCLVIHRVTQYDDLHMLYAC